MIKENRIIVLIDFSKNSEALTNYAFDFSEIINAKVIFAHRISGVVPAMADQSIRDEMVKSETEEAYSKLRQLVKRKIYSGDSFYVSQKPLHSLLKEVANENYFDWVLTGLKGTGPVKRRFIGSTTISIVNETDLLVLAVPLRISIPIPEKLLVGINPEYPLNELELNQILGTLKHKIKEIIFFTIIDEGLSNLAAKDYLLSLQEEFQEYKPVIHIYEGTKTFDIIKELIEPLENSYLVLQRGSRSVTDKLFRTFMINKFIFNGLFPIMVLPK